MARLRCVEIAKELLRDGTGHANRSLQAVIPIYGRDAEANHFDAVTFISC
jgi:hypothetical protein